MFSGKIISTKLSSHVAHWLDASLYLDIYYKKKNIFPIFFNLQRSQSHKPWKQHKLYNNSFLPSSKMPTIYYAVTQFKSLAPNKLLFS